MDKTEVKTELTNINKSQLKFNNRLKTQIKNPDKVGLIRQMKFRFYRKGFKVLPQFEAPLLEQFVTRNSRLQNIDSLKKGIHENLKQYGIQFQQNMQQIPLLHAPNLQKISITKNTWKYVSSISIKYDKISVSNIQDKMLLSTKYYQKLKQISISHQKFADSKCINLCKTIEKITITYCNLQKICVDGNFCQLQTSQINQSNQIQATQLKYLRYLDLSYNSIDRVSSLYAPNLKYLNLQKNCIMNLSFLKDIQFNHLKYLNLGENLFQEIHTFKMPQLTCLQLDKNKIKSLQALSNFKYKKLQILNLACNSISCLAKLHMPKLTNLNLQRNLFKQYRNNEFQQFPILEKLSFEANFIKIIQLIELSQLKFLNLSKNRLFQIPDLKTPKLQSIDLSNNKLSINYLNNFDRKPFQKLKKINLSDNDDINLLPKFMTPALQQLSVVSTKIINFDQFNSAQYPHLKSFGFQFCYKWSIQPHRSFPFLKFLSLQTMQIHSYVIDDLQDFSKCHFDNLKSLSLYVSNRFSLLPKIKAPLLRDFSIKSKSQVFDRIDIRPFLSYEYTYLENFKISNISTVLSPDKVNLQQISVNPKIQPQENIITPLPFISNQAIYQELLTKRLTVITIDLSKIQTSQFISFLNLDNVKKLQISSCRYQNVMRNLIKTDIRNLEKIKIIDNGQCTVIELGLKRFSKNRYFIVLSDQDLWRRTWSKNSSTYWRIQAQKYQNNFYYEVKDHLSYGQINSFQSSLQGNRFRKQIKMMKTGKY